MNVLINNTIIDTNICEVLKDNSYESTAYHKGAIAYKSPKGVIFYVRKANFSNVCDDISTSKNEPDYNEYYEPSYSDIAADPEANTNIDYYRDEIENEDDTEEIAELEEKIKELEEEQEYFDNYFSTEDKEKILNIDNIGFGASTTQDFNYKEWVIYVNDDIENPSFYLEAWDYENHYKAILDNVEAFELLLFIYNSYDEKKVLDILEKYHENFDLTLEV